ncbi:MAG: hypothetical protein IKP84_06075 [Prevotella sp.]|nr:hypothetical protein [Prevotella sp.]
MKFVKILLFAAALAFIPTAGSFAQLKKTAHIEKIKSFSYGHVVLFKTSTDDVDIFALSLSNASKYHKDVVFFLGNKEEMIKNLRDFSSALKEGKKGDIFDFTAVGEEYKLAYHKVVGEAGFKVSTRLSTSSDYGLLFKRTIDKIIEFLESYEN